MKYLLPVLLALAAVGSVVAGLRLFEVLRARRAANAAVAATAPLGVEAARDARQPPLFEVAPVPVPSGVPYSVAADGGAPHVVDRAALRSLLLHQSYAALNEAFEAYQAAFESNAALEGLPLDIHESTSTTGFSPSRTFPFSMFGIRRSSL